MPRKTNPAKGGSHPKSGRKEVATLSEPRLRVLRAVADLGPQVRLDTLVKHLDGHPNTTRHHLTALSELGYVHELTCSSCGVGRPAKCFTITKAGRIAEASSHVARTRISALELMAAVLAEQSAAKDLAYEAGHKWGTQAEQVTEENVEAMLTDVGFAPYHDDDGSFQLLACPLLDAAQKYPELICRVHAGYLAGRVDAATRLEPFAGEGYCRLLVGKRAADADAEGAPSITQVSDKRGPVCPSCAEHHTA
ncbi:putative ArsR family transcriptional regulator [Arcanobacterium wilhelmae]|uniref:ArsR family transcriptional regulator n=1 Tax=Arcanobacterium wilhelmae TaxID=1803177 RepID=A0ABT9NBW8_9ACTO|nr:helix-turn-helix domain-containing protein [Arcanobacterium wilhelmae]MDP9801190.1 putative ArsR family transcriptional regulator [Arcanobacterium wilhelmae]WFN90542.1 hypothetical protein P8A24_01385 [Arcanobacterium wilhelmae]